jgi:hypothetical protein
VLRKWFATRDEVFLEAYRGKLYLSVTLAL